LTSATTWPTATTLWTDDSGAIILRDLVAGRYSVRIKGLLDEVYYEYSGSVIVN
jgi:hypothetical protein